MINTFYDYFSSVATNIRKKERYFSTRFFKSVSVNTTKTHFEFWKTIKIK